MGSVIKTIVFMYMYFFKLYNKFNGLLFCQVGAVVVMIVWYLDVQSVSITTNVVGSIPSHGGVYSIHHYLIKFVNDLRQFGGILWVLRFPPPIILIVTTLLKYC
jgi:hypothetical protein